ncbi:hypothetical protein GCM10008090_19280 [Arenicella chitinivorans]|uniref:SlyX protein n=1 Tax=Arenicella chitinivorans TaxID=1329800 RepID=A0A918VM24_9GAMM|nr:SlyX family protein [Arenicella chitinivorans]GHA09417.1 hypothetical protein GCM10008090_19280 [Arenicella chitinivorans]
MSDQAVQDLQVKVAFLEDALTKLSDEFYAQQKELADLKLKYAKMLSRLRDQPAEDEGIGSMPHERPPHY